MVGGRVVGQISAERETHKIKYIIYMIYMNPYYGSETGYCINLKLQASEKIKDLPNDVFHLFQLNRYN